jgi:hypothetical protein
VQIKTAFLAIVLLCGIQARLERYDCALKKTDAFKLARFLLMP